MLSIVEKIKRLCENRNITIFTLEKELEFGNGSIRRWDEKIPAIDKVKKVANYFNVSTDYLIGSDTNNISPETYLLARKIDELDDEKREKLIAHFKATIDIYKQ